MTKNTDFETVGAMHQCKKGEMFSTCAHCGAMAEKLNSPCPQYMRNAAAAMTKAAPVAPAPMHAVPNLTLEPEMRAAMQAVFDAESVPVRPAPLTDTFVQTVPDKCDRIVWRNSYYHLPIAAAPKADHIPEKLSGDVGRSSEQS